MSHGRGGSTTYYLEVYPGGVIFSKTELPLDIAPSPYGTILAREIRRIQPSEIASMGMHCVFHDAVDHPSPIPLSSTELYDAIREIAEAAWPAG